MEDRKELIKNKLKNVDNNQLFELLLEETGGFGRYQVGLLVLSLLASFVAACNHLSPIYLTYTPKHTCVRGKFIFRQIVVEYRWSIVHTWARGGGGKPPCTGHVSRQMSFKISIQC
jgi:hypothetical protein